MAHPDAHVPTASASVRLVSAADKLYNARAILADFRQVGDEVWTRFKGGKEGTLWYYRSLITAFRRAGNSPLIDELDRVISELEQLVGKPAVQQEPLYLRLKSVNDLAPRYRRWNGNDDTQRNHHEAVLLSVDPFDLSLNWKPSSNSTPHFVGYYRFSLEPLLASGYIRRDSKPGYVRVRIFHDQDGSFYVEARRGGPRLLIGKVG